MVYKALANRSGAGALIGEGARKAGLHASGVLRLLRRQLELVGHSAEAIAVPLDPKEAGVVTETAGGTRRIYRLDPANP